MYGIRVSDGSHAAAGYVYGLRNDLILRFRGRSRILIRTDLMEFRPGCFFARNGAAESIVLLCFRASAHFSDFFHGNLVGRSVLRQLPDGGFRLVGIG